MGQQRDVDAAEVELAERPVEQAVPIQDQAPCVDLDQVTRPQWERDRQQDRSLRARGGQSRRVIRQRLLPDNTYETGASIASFLMDFEDQIAARRPRVVEEVVG